MKSQKQRTRILCAEPLLHDVSPQTARRAELGNFFEKVVVRVKEEGKLRCEFIYTEAGIECRLDVRDSVSQRKSNFLHCRRTRLANVITRNGDCVPTRQIIFAPGENIRDDAHGGPYRINVSSACDIFLQDD